MNNLDLMLLWNTNEYEKLAMRTAKDIGSNKMNLIHAAMGVSSDAGEFVDAIKKHAIYGKELDLDNCVEELGDVLWFVALACRHLGVSMAGVMAANINKLSERYPDKYTDEAAIARADKVELDVDLAEENCWERAAATGVDHIWYNTKSGNYAYSDEAEQLSSSVYYTAAEAITALNAYVKWLKEDHSSPNQTHPIEVGNWGIPTAAPDNLKCNCLQGVCMGIVGIICRSAEDKFGLNRAVDFHDKERTGGEG